MKKLVYFPAHGFYLLSVLAMGSWQSGVTIAAELPVIDTHIHYSHDAWEQTPPENAVAILREAGFKKAFVSSSSVGKYEKW